MRARTPISVAALLFSAGALAALALLLAAVGAVTFARYVRANAPNPHLVAIAPFDVLVPGGTLDGWRTALARELTAALAEPPLVTVPQDVIRERWHGAPRPEIAAVEVARRTRAGTAIYGRIDPAPRQRGGGERSDSVRIRLIVADAASSRVLFAVVQTWPPRDSTALARKLAAQIRAHHPSTRPPVEP